MAASEVIAAGVAVRFIVAVQAEVLTEDLIVGVVEVVALVVANMRSFITQSSSSHKFDR